MYVSLQFPASQPQPSSSTTSSTATSLSKPSVTDEDVIVVKEEPSDERASVTPSKGKPRGKAAEDEDSMILKVSNLTVG